MPDQDTVATRLVALRKRFFASQTALSAATGEAAKRLGGSLKGIDRTNISAWENGRGEPSTRSMTVLAAAYNVSRGVLRQYLDGDITLRALIRKRTAVEAQPTVVGV